MPWHQQVADGVTVTWAGDRPVRRRSAPRRLGAVRTWMEPVPRVRPDAQDLARIGRVRDREQLAALLGADGALARGSASDPSSALELRPFVASLVAQGMDRNTLLLALLDLGHDEVEALRALWWGERAERRSLVLTLLHEEGWSGERVHLALGAMGLDAAERAAVVDPLGW